MHRINTHTINHKTYNIGVFRTNNSIRITRDEIHTSIIIIDADIVSTTLIGERGEHFNSNRNRFNNHNLSNYRGNNFRENIWGYKKKTFYLNHNGNSLFPNQGSVKQSDNSGDGHDNQVSQMQSASLVRAIPSESCSTCATLYRRDQDAILEIWTQVAHCIISCQQPGQSQF